jgi:acyl-CoA reductase-like NAD-dependent aldehyde dehydrogenase
MREFFPNGSRSSPDFARIVNDRHFERLTDLLRRTKGKVVLGGHSDSSTREMELTIVTNVEEGDSLLEEEIFGPILAIVVQDVGSRLF